MFDNLNDVSLLFIYINVQNRHLNSYWYMCWYVIVNHYFEEKIVIVFDDYVKGMSIPPKDVVHVAESQFNMFFILD